MYQKMSPINAKSSYYGRNFGPNYGGAQRTRVFPQNGNFFFYCNLVCIRVNIINNVTLKMLYLLYCKLRR